MADTRPASDCASTDKQYGGARRSVCAPPKRHDLRGLKWYELLARLRELDTWLDCEERGAMGYEVRLNILNDHRSTMAETICRLTEGLKKKQGAK